MTVKSRFFILSFILGIAIPQLSLADIYKYTDEEGVIHLTNVPRETNANYVLVLREKPVHFAVSIGADITKYDSLIAKAGEKH